MPVWSWSYWNSATVRSAREVADPEEGRAPDRTRLLEIQLHRPALGLVLARLTGEIDLSTAFLVARLGTEFVRPGITMSVDLRQVRFLGAAGLAALVGLHDRAEQAGGRLLVVGTRHRQVRVPLQVCGLDELLGPPPVRPPSAPGGKPRNTCLVE